MIIKITNWNQHQHYRHRRPPWIKLQTDIIDEYDETGTPKKFRALSNDAKLTFIMLIILASRYDGSIPTDDLNWIEINTGLTAENIMLAPLIEAGYISVCERASSCASNNASKCASNVATQIVLQRQSKRQSKNIYDEQFEKCWTMFEKYGVRKKAIEYWNKIPQADRDAIEIAIPDHMAAIMAGRTRKQFEGWINPENRLWDMDWKKAEQVAKAKNGAKPLNNTLSDANPLNPPLDF